MFSKIKKFFMKPVKWLTEKFKRVTKWVKANPKSTTWILIGSIGLDFYFLGWILSLAWFK